MPWTRNLYPKNWESIANSIKDSVDWNCEECGKPCRQPQESQQDFEDRIRDTPWEDDYWEEYHDDETGEWGFIPHPQRFTLTVAHLNHEPQDCRTENLRALCAPCHCRYDQRPESRAIKERLRLERNGQLSLFSL